jgi:hypothetical protein
MAEKYDIRPDQSVELLKELHILTRDGKLNQDSRRKLKQVYHLYQFIEPLLNEIDQSKGSVSLVDHGSGKSYLGFILYDLHLKKLENQYHVYCVENRVELIKNSRILADKLGFENMSFHDISIADSIESQMIPATVDIVTALHACDTATDDAIKFALEKDSQYIVVVPCCQAEVSTVLRKNKDSAPLQNALAEIWRRPIHTREFGSLITNVLRGLQLEAHGYQVKVTELVGWEHSMKNELMIAKKSGGRNSRSEKRLTELLETLGLQEMQHRFFTPAIEA